MIKIKNIYSSPKSIMTGVPQGSVLGPILFLIYVNSLFIQPFKGKVTAFADDTALSYSNKSLLNVFSDVNHDLDLLRKWFSIHKLTISDKTKFMIFNINSKICDDLPLFYHSPSCTRFRLSNNDDNTFSFNYLTSCCSNCFKIECVDNFKYLGIVLDNKLSWYNHTRYLKQYLNKVVRQLYHLSLYCPQSILKLVYNGLLKSKLECGIPCWGGAFFITN